MIPFPYQTGQFGRRAVPVAAGDPNFANVELLLHMEGTNGSTTFTDSSSKAVTVTAAGNAQISTAQFKFGAASGLFDGSGDSLGFPNPTLHSVDLTVECFFRITNGSKFQILITSYNLPGGAQAGTFIFYVTNANQLAVGNGVANVIGTTTLATNTWYYGAFTVDIGATTFRLFLDGTLEGTGTLAHNAGSSTVYIGGSPGDGNIGTWWFDGYIDELRITKGVQRYTTSFTPPSAPFPDS